MIPYLIWPENSFKKFRKISNAKTVTKITPGDPIATILNLVDFFAITYFSVWLLPNQRETLSDLARKFLKKNM